MTQLSMRFFRFAIYVLVGFCISGCNRSTSKDSAVPGDISKKDGATLDLNPKFPVVEGKYQMTKKWSITLPGKFNRRFEDNDLVIWRPGITAWIVVWNNDKKQTSQERCKAIRDDASHEAFELEEFRDGPILYFAYRLIEKREEGVVQALYCFAFSDDGHVQMAVYFDAERDLDIAKAMWRGLKEMMPD